MEGMRFLKLSKTSIRPEAQGGDSHASLEPSGDSGCLELMLNARYSLWWVQ